LKFGLAYLFDVCLRFSCRRVFDSIAAAAATTRYNEKQSDVTA